MDTPTAISNPTADIGDVYAWTAPDGRRLNLIMTIVGRSFSDRIDYVFHIDSGKVFGRTTAGTVLSCRFPTPRQADCRLGSADRATGEAGRAEGLVSRRGRFRIFAGQRDDPFFNNVRGTRQAYGVAAKALAEGAARDDAGCPRFDAETTRRILATWRATDGGPPRNFLQGWTSSAIVVSVELSAVNRGGPLLAVWGSTSAGGRQIDRAARPLTANALLGTLAPEDESDRLKETYNAATPATARGFVPELEKGLAFYDGLDGRCGNAFLADPAKPGPDRYQPLATLLADDRIWVDSASTQCRELFAVERAALRAEFPVEHDCGGRAPSYDAANVYRSLLVSGATTGVDDGLTHDEIAPSDAVFPFLAAPAGPPRNP